MFTYHKSWLAAFALLPTCMTGQLAAQVVLSVDRDTGSATIRNDDDIAQVDLDGYSILSSNSLLNSTGWTSFQDLLIAGWEEAPTSDSNGLAEFNSNIGGVATLGPNASVSIGEAYTTDFSSAMSSVGFGNTYEDVTFRYADATLNEIVTGAVEYVGAERFNNLVLQIDVASGGAQLINESPELVTIDFYQITSAASVLQPGFSGLTQDASPVAGWETGGANNANGLAQFFSQPASGFTVPGGEVYDLGTTFLAGDPSRDVDLLFRVVGGADAGFDGEVRFVVPETLSGDYNNDGFVDAADYTVWRDNEGAEDESLINNAGDGSGVIDEGDYTVWVDNYGASSASAASGTAVPEPNSLLLGVSIAATLLAGRRVVAAE